MNTRLRNSLRKVRLSGTTTYERDRYRDLYNDALAKLQAARHPHF